MTTPQASAQTKFAWTCLVLQITFALLYFLLARYAPSADAKHIENQLGHDHELEKNVAKYPSKSS